MAAIQYMCMTRQIQYTLAYWSTTDDIVSLLHILLSTDIRSFVFFCPQFLFFC